MLVLDTHTLGKVKRYRFWEDDKIDFKLKGQPEAIAQITDSSFLYTTYNPILEEYLATEVKLNTVKKSDYLGVFCG